MRSLVARPERWPIAGAFVIARGSKTEAVVVTVEIADGPHVGRGEGTPYPRYGETVDGVLAEIEEARAFIEAGRERGKLQAKMRPGAARNAIDCALWDLEAKRTGRRAFEIAGRERLDPVKTAFTISLGPPETMAEQAAANAHRPLLKLKLGGPGDLDRVEAVRRAAPRSRLIVDANEALSFDDFERLAPDFAKLDKAGGLTEALALAAEARALGLQLMIGCMVSTSLAMAPALILAQGAPFVDLDGPLLLAKDREPGLTYIGSMIEPPARELWG